MDIDQLKSFKDTSTLPTPHLRAIWLDLHGEWDAAHRIVQVLEDQQAMWIHAYLHRKEPDLPNARYWYRNAGRPFPDQVSFEQEAEEILFNLSE